MYTLKKMGIISSSTQQRDEKIHYPRINHLSHMSAAVIKIAGVIGIGFILPYAIHIY